jgi:uncharacterized protein HemX
MTMRSRGRAALAALVATAIGLGLGLGGVASAQEKKAETAGGAFSLAPVDDWKAVRTQAGKLAKELAASPRTKALAPQVEAQLAQVESTLTAVDGMLKADSIDPTTSSAMVSKLQGRRLELKQTMDEITGIDKKGEGPAEPESAHKTRAELLGELTKLQKALDQKRLQILRKTG